MIGIIGIFTLNCKIDSEILFVVFLISLVEGPTRPLWIRVIFWPLDKSTLVNTWNDLDPTSSACGTCMYTRIYKNDATHVCTRTGTQTRAESNEFITDMTEGLPFFPLLRPCIGIRKLPAVVLSYEGQIETSPSLACALRGFSRTRNTAAPSYPPINSLRVWRSEFSAASATRAG